MNKLIVLGTCQDGGYPQSGCIASCCLKVKNSSRLVSSIAVTNKNADQCWIFDASPDIKYQLNMLDKYMLKGDFPNISGIFLTHAHIGHYLGLLSLGLEVMNLRNVPVYAMPKMVQFIKRNAPFSQLVEKNNIILRVINNDSIIHLDSGCTVSPFNVPHRNEFSETVGYSIKTNISSTIFIPDIDSWDQWDINLLDFARQHDLLFLDGTFYHKDELELRDISKVPHPSIVESINLFSALDKDDREKIYFTHFNHTNKVLKSDSDERLNVHDSGFKIAKEGQEFNI